MSHYSHVTLPIRAGRDDGLVKGTAFGLSVTALAAFAVDALTKTWAERLLQVGVPVAVFGDSFRLTLGYNTGVAFGLFAGSGPLVLILTGTAVLAIAVWLLRSRPAGTFTAAAGGLIVGGGAANFIDRLPDGRVTDLLDMGIGALRWPSFNLADSAIVIGIALLLAVTGRTPART